MGSERARVEGGGFTSASGSVRGVVAIQLLSPAVPGTARRLGMVVSAPWDPTAWRGRFDQCFYRLLPTPPSPEMEVFFLPEF